MQGREAYMHGRIYREAAANASLSLQETYIIFHVFHLLYIYLSYFIYIYMHIYISGYIVGE